MSVSTYGFRAENRRTETPASGRHSITKQVSERSADRSFDGLLPTNALASRKARFHMSV